LTKQHDKLSSVAKNQFAALDLVELRRVTRGDLLVDGRGVIDPGRAAAAGFRYRGVSAHSAPEPAQAR